MKIRGKFVIPVTILVIIAAVVVIFSTRQTTHNLIQNNEETFSNYTRHSIEKQADKRQANIQSSIDALGQIALQQAAIFSEVPEVRSSYRFALLGDLDDENDYLMQMGRTHLRRTIQPFLDGYKNVTGIGPLKLHFHTSSARSLARLWRKGWQAKRNGKKVDISDDLSSFRQTVVDINASDGGHKPLAGIEIGRGGFAIRGLAPIKDERGHHMGSVEILLPFLDAIKLNVNKASNYQIATYMFAEKLPIATKLQDPKKIRFWTASTFLSPHLIIR